MKEVLIFTLSLFTLSLISLKRHSMARERTNPSHMRSDFDLL